MAQGKPSYLRLETAVRGQREFQDATLDELLPDPHRARDVWDYVERQDLTALYARVRTTTMASGRPAIDPAILVALWLYATLEGVGSARLLDRLCGSDIAYRWLVGGVSVNYHTLADFRTTAGAFLDELLSRSVAGLVSAGLVELEAVAVDGLRLRASAGSGSFRSGERLQELHRAAAAKVARLRAELAEDPQASVERRRARQAAAAADRLRRLDEAIAAHAEVSRQRSEEERSQRRKQPRKRRPVRASTSDPQARVMKMADGGFRPAYNVQIVTAADGAHIVGIKVTNRSSDRGLLGPAVDEVERRYGSRPSKLLADSGFDSKSDIERLHADRIELFCPLSKTRADPSLPLRSDGPGVRAWRQRMAWSQAMAVYRKRFATERPHADMRNRGLHRLLVRGIDKVRAVVLWHVHAFNFLQMQRLHPA
jgi:transposase